ncbi:Rpn family recombination-promoting nuclease/putative transposase [Peptococcaceae bacterium]|nr:Rpn family recombination-promoting nuclease/putative transposase [Peptococcaceae bacterium]
MGNIRDLDIDEIRELIIKNPHDSFFKYSLQDLDIARNFIASYLPDEIVELLNLSTIKSSKDSFVDSKLKSYFIDMLFSVSLNNQEIYLYFLFEHKSSPEKDVPIQLLRYMTRIWEMIRQNTKGTKDKLPVIIPLVIYHGDRAWNIGLRLSDLLEHIPGVVKRHIPDYEYLLHDLSQLSEDEIKGNVKVQLFVEVLKAAFARDVMNEIYRILKLLRELIEPGSSYDNVVFLYLANTNDGFNFDKAAEIDSKLKTGKGDVIMSVAKKLIEKGKQEGWQEGRQEALIKTARKALIKGMDVDDVVELTELPKDEVLKLLVKVKN